jgi:hypothetical protein
MTILNQQTMELKAWRGDEVEHCCQIVRWLYGIQKF